MLLKLHQSLELFLGCIKDDINYKIYVAMFWFYWNLVCGQIKALTACAWFTCCHTTAVVYRN